MASNIAPGAEYKHHRPLPSIIASHTVPDIPENSIVIGVCGVIPTEEALIDENDGWFMSDFCAFNYLLKGIRSHQTWITAASEESFLRFIDEHPEYKPGFLHGNPYKDRKVVFSRALVEQKELTPFCVRSRILGGNLRANPPFLQQVSQPKAIVKEFEERLHQAVAASELWTPRRPIVILIFGHGTESLGVYLDYSKKAADEQALFAFSSIKKIIPEDISTSVITTSCYSGGWAIQKDLNKTALTAGGPLLDNDGEQGRPNSLSWNISASIGRACGSVFATTLIKNLISSSSPLCGDPSLVDESESLQVARLSDQQTETYNAFCCNIVSNLQDRVTKLYDYHDFRFAAQDDDWAQSWLGRIGLPLSHFETRWKRLGEYVSTMPNSLANQDPLNQLDTYQAAENQEGFISALEESMRGRLSVAPVAPSSLRLQRPTHSHTALAKTLRIKAWLLATSCPGEMTSGFNLRLRGQLLRYAEGRPSTTAYSDALEKEIVYRVDVSTFVDNIVRSYNLPRSQGKSLLDWDYYLWACIISTSSEQAKAHKERVEIICKALVDAGLDFAPALKHVHFFERGHKYLAACISISPLSITQANTLIQEIAQGYGHEQETLRSELA
jgi:hypothetical protein